MMKSVVKDGEKIKAVLEILRTQAPLTLKQEKFCSDDCVSRFLRAKRDNVKKAARHLRTCLSWRESIGAEHLIADEFGAEIANGVAYVAGYDDEFRPVVVLRMKPDYQKFQKRYVRVLVFTLEVAIGTMHRKADQFVVLFDASFFRSSSACLNLLCASLKITSDYYPGRLHRLFVVDPPARFSLMWKSVRAFVDFSSSVVVVASSDFSAAMEDAFEMDARTSSLRYTPLSTAKIGASSSSRFTFTVSHLDSLKPWYLSRVDMNSSDKTGGPQFLQGPALVSPLNARSYSFASPAARTPRDGDMYQFHRTPRTPWPSFLRSPAAFLRKDTHLGKCHKLRDSFMAYVKFYRNPYDEISYRSKMKPPLGGLISIIPHQLKRRQSNNSSPWL